MRRILNLRIMLAVAVGETVLIFICLLSSVSLPAGIVAVSAYYALLVTACVLCRKFSAKKLLAAFVICIAVGIATNISYGVRLATYHMVSPISGETYRLAGRVDSVVAEAGTVKSIFVSDAKIDGKKIGGNVRVVFEEDDLSAEFFSVGDRVESVGSLYRVELVDGGKVNGSAYRRDERYKFYTAFSDSTVTPEKARGLAAIRESLYQRLLSACGDDYGAIAYCMLSGDKNELSSATVRLYALGGIGHVLAVSGLHVGIIAALVQFVLGKLKVNRIVRCAAVTAMLLTYAVFVDMASSVLRAVIMCVILMVSMLTGRRYDHLSALSCAYSLILAAEPFLLFEAGFVMSFSAVFGLILFAKTFAKYLRRIRIPKFIATPLAGTAAVHLAIVPVSACFFGSIQTYSVLVNLLVVPLLSVTFMFFVLALPISMLFGINILFRAGAIGFAFTDILLELVDYLPLGSLNVASVAALFVLFPLFFFMSRFFMLPKRKRTVSITAFAVCVAIVVVPTLATLTPSSQLRYSVIPVNSYGDVTTVLADGENVTVIGDVKDCAALKYTLKDYNIRKVDCIVLNKLDLRVGEGLSDFVSDFKVDKVVCPAARMQSDGLAALGKYKNFYTLEDVSLPGIRRITAGNSHIGYTYEYDSGISVMCVSYSARYNKADDDTINSAAVIRCFMYLNDMPDRVYLTNMPVGYLGKIPTHQFSLADAGEFVYKVNSGEILKKNNM